MKAQPDKAKLAEYEEKALAHRADAAERVKSRSQLKPKIINKPTNTLPNDPSPTMTLLGANTRGAIYILIAMISALMTELNNITGDELSTMIWIDWLKIAGSIILPGLVAWRAYIDGSFARFEMQKDDAKNTI